VKSRERWVLLALLVLLLPVLFLAPSSRAHVARIWRGALLSSKTVLSLPRSVLSHAMLGDSENGVITGSSYHNDTSPLLRDMKPVPIGFGAEREANENPKITSNHKDSPDEAVQNAHVSAPNIPAPITRPSHSSPARPPRALRSSAPRPGPACPSSVSRPAPTWTVSATC
jgi:hypothetical protein